MRDILPIKRPRRRPNPRGRGAAPSIVERDKIVDQIQSKIETGYTATAASRSFDISAATFYRWKSQKIRNHKVRVRISNANFDLIEDALSRMADPLTSEHDLTNSIFILSGFLRWPLEHRYVQFNTLICHINYYRQSDSVFMRDLPDEIQKLIIRDLDLDLISEMLSPIMEFTFNHEEPGTRTNPKPFTLRSWLSDIGLVIFDHEPEVGKNNSKLSINKLYNIMKNGYFMISRDVGFNVFRSDFWNFAACLPFLYVEQYEDFDFILDPYSVDFNNKVNKLKVLRAELSLYLSRCHFVVERFKANLDRRTLEGIAFPLFPPTLPPIAPLPREEEEM